MCTSNRDDRKLEKTVKKSWFKHLGELHKEWTEAGVSASRVTTLRLRRSDRSSGKGLPSHFWNRNIVRGILPGLRRKRTGLLLSCPTSSFQVKVHFAFNLEIKIPESGGRVERHIIHVAWSPGVLLRGRWETPDQTMQMTWRPLSKQPGLHYTWAVPQADCLHATPHWCSNSCKRRLNQVLNAQKLTYFSEAWYFWLKYTFLWILCNIQIFWDTKFWVFIICSHNHKHFKK